MRLFFWLSAALLAAASAACAADTIAVLPLFNADEHGAPNLDWIGESVSETIDEALSTGGLLVLTREDREEVYHRLSLRPAVVLTKASVLKIGETLDAGQIIFGELHVDGAEAGPTSLKTIIRLAVRIIDLKKMKQGPEFSESGPLENLSQMETKLSYLLLKQLNPGGAPSEEVFFHDRAPVRVDAMESYVRGLMATNEDQKLKLFTQAAKLDEHFSQPNFQLGRTLFTKKDYKNAEPWLSKVSRADSHFPEAAFLRGICKFQAADFDGAIDQFRMVSNERPLNEVFNNLGAALSRKNDAAAADNFKKALDGDEADPDYWFNLGYWLWKQARFDLAATHFRAVLDRNSGDQEATTFLGRCLRKDGPRAGDPRTENRERIKTTFEDSAWKQLQAELRNKK